MAAQSIPDVERRVLLTYLEQRWLRSRLTALGAYVPGDPGYDVDQVCPIVYIASPFDPSKDSDIAQISAYAARELRGYGRLEVEISGSIYDGLTLQLDYVDPSWILNTDSGDVVVVPSSPVINGEIVTFTLPDATTFSGEVAGRWLHGVGFLVINLAEGSVVQLDRGSRGSSLATKQMMVMIACPPSSSPATADAYAGALASLFRGVVFRSDPSPSASELLSAMDDAGILQIYQNRSTPIKETPVYLRDQGGWSWFQMTIEFERQFRRSSVGVQEPVYA